MCIRVAIDLHLFETIAVSKQPKTAAQLAETSGADELLIGEFSALMQYPNMGPGC